MYKSIKSSHKVQIYLIRHRLKKCDIVIIKTYFFSVTSVKIGPVMDNNESFVKYNNIDNRCSR